MIKVKKLKVAKCLRTKMLLFAMVTWVFTILSLILENRKPKELFFIPIGAMALTLIYFKMNDYVKKIENRP